MNNHTPEPNKDSSNEDSLGTSENHIQQGLNTSGDAHNAHSVRASEYGDLDEDPVNNGFDSPPPQETAERDDSAPQIIFDPKRSRPTAVFLKIMAHEDAPKEEEKLDTTAEDSLMDDKRRPMARSANTEQQYRIRVKGLYKHSYELRTVDPQFPVEPSPMDMVSDLIESATPGTDGTPARRSISSWRLYRSALLWHLSMNRHIHSNFEMAYQELARIKYPQGVVEKSPKRAKMTFSGDDFNVLINQLGSMNKKNSVWGSRTSYWLQAGVAAGARVNEWYGTEWLDRDKLLLRIPNSKQKASAPAFRKMKGNADTQVVSVYDLPDPISTKSSDALGWVTEQGDPVGDDEEEFDDEVDNEPDGIGSHRVVRINRNDAIYVDMQLLSIEAHAQEQEESGVSRERAYERYNKMLRVTLRRACEVALKGKHYYTLRHPRSQFAALMKVANPIGAVAAMMGHTSTRTTMGSYGSRHAGLKSKSYEKLNSTQEALADMGEQDSQAAESWISSGNIQAPSSEV